jgi:hypothetical protein
MPLSVLFGFADILRLSEADDQFFFVHKGGLNVNIHRTSFNVGPGAMFMVPRGKWSCFYYGNYMLTATGNKYSIENISGIESELFFAQARKATETEEEEARRQEHAASQTPGASGSKRKSVKSVEPETDAESVVSTKKTKKKKKV